ncbi:MAG: hypothetical protein HYY96_15325 [Candidatus Tectomicrobia bacterium]|nr:hypothetical protein [Candidatus Tectomicrobia bacterium]
MTHEEKIKEFGKRAGAHEVGIAAAADFDAYAPEGFRPTDLLPGAKAVVAAAGAPHKAGDWISPNPFTMEATSTADRINGAGRRITSFIEEEFGYYALYVPPGPRSGHTPFLSLQLCAELAGLGTRSIAGPTLHAKWGMLYFTAVVTTMPLAADGPLPEPVCPAPACIEMFKVERRTPCTKVCPDCLHADLDVTKERANGLIKLRTYDRERCHTRSQGFWIGGFQKALEEVLNEPDKERRKMMLYGDYFTRTLWAITFSAQNIGQCFECMRVCPVGLEARILK